MIKGGKGGANTRSGRIYERKMDLVAYLRSKRGFAVKSVSHNRKSPDNVFDIYYQGELKAQLFKQHGLYRFLKAKGVDWKKYLSRKLVPDSGIYVIVGKTLFIIEMKVQNGEGSVDEKLQTCDFKKRQYEKLVSSLGLKVRYWYLLSDWFKQSKYKDVLNYIEDVGCKYFFGDIPLEALGLPSK